MACPDPSAIDSLARGRLTPKAAAELGEHIRTCPACSKKYAQVAVQITLRDSGRQSPAPVATPPAPAPDVLGIADTIRRPPSDPGVDPAAPAGSESAHPRGSAIGRYVILDRIGAGGMGIVYAAFDPDLDRKIALKILRADILGSSAAKELRLRLLREAQAMARLSHPNVITVHDVGIVGDQVFVAMEFVDGQTLAEWAASETRSWRQILEVYLKAGHGLAAAHAAGLVHRDFKPDNVIIGKDGRVRVMDFGLVHAVTAPKAEDAPEPPPAGDKAPMRRRITQPGTLLGTPAYMSPEQLQSKPTDPRSDQFSFCVALFEALYGERPFAAESAGALVAEITENRVRPEPSDTEVPGRIRRILLRGLRHSPSERYRSFDALLIGLGRRKSTVRRRWILLGSAALAATAAVGAAVAVRSHSGSCAGVADKLAGTWDAKVKSEARAAFLATGKPYAAQAWDKAAGALDAYSKAWVTERTSACEATRQRGAETISSDEALGHRIVCLGRRLDEVHALAKLFARADAEVVERAVAASLALPALSGCNGPATAHRVTAGDAAAQAQAEILRGKLAEAKACHDAGKYSLGLAAAGEAVELARRLTDRSSEAEALFFVGALKLRSGDARSAEKLLEESALVAEAAREDGVAARAWTELVGAVGASQARYAEGRDRARFARASIDRLGGDTELEASLHNNLGVISWMQGRYDEALGEHQKALDLRQRTFGPGHPIVAKSLSNIGIVLKAQGRYAEALSHYEKAQAIEERALAPEHPAVAETLNNFGNVLNEEGRRDEALRYMRRALAIKEKAYGPEQLTVAITLNNIAAVLAQQGRFDEALATQERSLAIKLKAVSPTHPTIASSLTNLAEIQRDLRRFGESLENDTRALAIREKTFGAEHADLAYNLVGIGEAQLGLKRPAQALPPLERALSLRAKSSGDELLLAESRFVLAKALVQARKDPVRAIALARQARDQHAAAGEKAEDGLAEIDAWLAAQEKK